MAGILLLTVVMSAHGAQGDHVRPIDARIRALVSAGLSRSETFRGLVAALDASDVIVYIEPRVSRHALGGYLLHNIVATGGFRYLRIAIDVEGGSRRLLALLAHELQHALEVARAPHVRDSEGVRQLFSQSTVPFGCVASHCYETRSAMEVEIRVRNEWAAR